MSLSKKEVKRITELYYADVYKFAFAKMREKEAALEITQETFVVFFEKSEKLKDEEIKKWLICVCANKVKEYFRKQNSARNYVSISDAEDMPYYDRYDAAETAFADGDDRDVFDEVQRRILALLTPEEQRVFVELFFAKKDIKIFAEEENISENAAAARKSRLKSKVKRLYKDTYFLLFVILFGILQP